MVPSSQVVHHRLGRRGPQPDSDYTSRARDVLNNPSLNAGNDVSDRRGVSGEQAIGSLSKRYPVERGTDSGGADLFYPPRCRPDNEPDKDFNPMRIFARSLTTRKCRKVVQNGVIRADKTNCRPVGVLAILLIGLKFLSCSLSDRQRGG